jgi:hypothetical protein
VRIHDALRVTGRAGRVTHARRVVFIDLDPLEVFAGLCNEILITDRIRQAGLRHVRAVGHDDDAFEGLERRCELLDQRHERKVREQILIFRVVRDVDQLLGEEPRVQRVAHRAQAHDPVPSLDVAVRVPGQRRDDVALVDA